MIYEYRGTKYPDYLKQGGMSRFILPVALHFCRGRGVDVGAGSWPLPGAVPVEASMGGDAFNISTDLRDHLDYVFSSHCLEHVDDPIAALEHWRDCLRPGGVLFLYLPHPDMIYWRPEFCRKHLHSWTPAQMADTLRHLGLRDVMVSERDFAWSFVAMGFK